MCLGFLCHSALGRRWFRTVDNVFWNIPTLSPEIQGEKGSPKRLLEIVAKSSENGPQSFHLCPLSPCPPDKAVIPRLFLKDKKYWPWLSPARGPAALLSQGLCWTSPGNLAAPLPPSWSALRPHAGTSPVPGPPGTPQQDCLVGPVFVTL